MVRGACVGDQAETDIDTPLCRGAGAQQKMDTISSNSKLYFGY